MSAGLWPEGVEGASANPSGIERSLSRQIQWTAPRAREGMSGLLRSAIAKISRGFVQAFEGVFEVDDTKIPE
jgi:hypothetical protein